MDGGVESMDCVDDTSRGDGGRCEELSSVKKMDGGEYSGSLSVLIVRCTVAFREREGGCMLLMRWGMVLEKEIGKEREMVRLMTKERRIWEVDEKGS